MFINQLKMSDMSIKKMLFIFLFLAFPMHLLLAQDNDDILGKWQNPSGEGRVDISKKGDEYVGTLYWLKEPNDEHGNPKKDVNNPDKDKQNRTIEGTQILQGFNAKGKGIYEDGTIYDPKSGKTYSSKMTLKGDDELAIRGYVGVSLIGRTETWTRVKQ